MLLLLISTHCICIFVKGCSLHLDSARSEIQILDFDWITESPGSFKKNKKQNNAVLVKKNQRVATGFLTGSTSRVTPGFSFPCFFLNPARF